MKGSKKFIFTLSILMIAGMLLTACKSNWDAKLGTEENPIIFAAVPSGETERVTAGFDKMADLIYQNTGLVIEPFVATSYAGVIEALCQDPPKAHMASLATFSYILASEKGCAETALVSTRYGSASYNGQFIVSADSDYESIEDLKGATWCVPDAFSTSGAIANHLGLLAARTGQSPGADPRSMLVLGPWSPGIPAVTGERDYGTRQFDTAAHLDYDALVLDFMDLHVRGLCNHLAQARPVRYFVMGDNQWREEDSWPPAAAKPYAIHLGPRREGRATNRLSHAVPAPGPLSSTFVADPAKPVREIPGSDLGPMDQRELTPHGDLLLFESRPLKRKMTIAGHIRAEIYVSSDAPDLDLYVKLLDVAADGTTYNLMDSGAEVLRASLRRVLRGKGRKKQLLEPGQIYRLDLDSLLTANTFHPGDRIRVVLCASWFPGMARNLQTGEDEAVSALMRPARITVHHDAEHPSRLLLPVLPQAVPTRPQTTPP